MPQRTFLLALIAALLVSLTGQGIARVGVPAAAASMTMAGMPEMGSADCMKKMAEAPGEKGKCSLADCIAAGMASCSATALLPQATDAPTITYARPVHLPVPAHALAGRSLPPDLRPPSILI